MTSDSGTPQALLVLGMHRSGTSAVAGALRAAGFALGDDLLQPSSDNPKGFWEHAGVIAIHDRLLAALGREWNDPRDLPAGWLDSEAARQASVDLEALLRRDFDGVPRWAVKDPRMCRLLDLWWPILQRMGVRPAALFVVRDPREVAASLAVRNRWPEGLSALLWSQHILDAEAASADVARTVIDYGAFVAAPVEALAAALRALGVDDGMVHRARERIAGFVSSDDRHHDAADAQHDPAWELPLALYAALRSADPWQAVRAPAARYRESAALYSEALDGFARVPELERAQRRTVEVALEDATAELAQRAAWASALGDRLSLADQQIERLQAEHAQAVDWAKDLTGKLQAADRKIEQLQAEHAQAVGWAKDTADRLQAADARIAQLQDEHAQAVDWAKDVAGKLGAADVRIGQLQAEHAQAVAWAKDLDGQLLVANERVDALREAQAEAARRTQALEAELLQARDDVRQREERVEALESRLAASDTRVASLQADLGRVSRELQQSRGEYQTLIHSRSWALTRPLRFAGRLLRGDWAGVAGSLRNSGVGRHAWLAPVRKAGARWLARRARGPVEPVAVHVEEVAADPSQAVRTLRLPQADAPVVSIIVPTYGNLDYTLACLQSIERHAGAVPFEVIVAEDASGDAAMARLRDVSGLRYLEHPQNLGFLRSCNKAAESARGEYVFFLNNDTEVTAGWMEALLAVFHARDDAGMVGSRLVYPDGRLQEAGGIVWSDCSAWNYGRLQDPDRGEFNYVKEADYISGAAIMLRTRVFRELGGFDEHFVPAYCEDTDLAFRVRAAGMKVYLQPASTVVHHEGISHGTDTGQGIKAYQVVNQRKMLERWRDTLAREHFDNGEYPFLARDRSQLRKTVLVIDHYVPQPDRDAGSRTMWQFMRLFQKHGMTVKFWPDNQWHDPVYTPMLQQAGIEVLAGPEYAAGFEDWIREHGAMIDCVLLSRPHVSINYVEALRLHSPATRLYYGHDVHHLRMREQLKLEPSEELQRETAKIEGFEHAVWRAVDTIYYPSDTETAQVASWLHAEAGRAQASTIPVYAFDAFPDAPWSNLATRRGLVFVAGFAHAPNADAAAWFVHEVWPLLRARHPALRLTLVGSNPTEAVRALAGGAIEVTGFVPDDVLAAHYRDARVAVAPLRYGGGMKGKVVEAMRFGIPCVTTAAGAQGFSGTDDFLAVGESPEAFAAHVLRLLDDDAAWHAVSRASQAFARERFSEEALWRVVARDVDPSPYPSVAARREHLQRAARSAGSKA